MWIRTGLAGGPQTSGLPGVSNDHRGLYRMLCRKPGRARHADAGLRWALSSPLTGILSRDGLWSRVAALPREAVGRLSASALARTPYQRRSQHISPKRAA